MSIVNKIFNFQFSIFNFFRWHPEVAIRYWPIARSVKCQVSSVKEISILEVGSGWLGIAPYLGKEVVGLDEDFEGRKFGLLKQIKGSVLKLPFKRDSFDFVVCVDVLEHLQKTKREKAIREVLRVAKREVFIAVPCGKKSFIQDKKLDKRYQQVFKQPFSFFKEHLEYGLPKKEEIVQLIKLAAKREKKKVGIKIQGNENLGLRNFLMKGWMTKNIFVDFLFRKIFLFLIPFFKLWDKPPYYRQIFFVKIEGRIK